MSRTRTEIEAEAADVKDWLGSSWSSPNAARRRAQRETVEATLEALRAEWRQATR